MVAGGNIWQQALVGQDVSEFGQHHRTVNSAHTTHTHTHTPHTLHTCTHHTHTHTMGAHTVRRNSLTVFFSGEGYELPQYVHNHSSI